MKSRCYILDSFALLAYFQDEPGADEVESLLLAAERGDFHLLLSMINLGEILYTLSRRSTEQMAANVYVRISHMPIQRLPVSEATVLAAARIKARYPVSYADAFAIAAAQEFDCPVVTGDPEFRRVAQTGMVKLMWVGA